MRNLTATHTALGALDVVANPPWPAARRSRASAVRSTVGLVALTVVAVLGELLVALARSGAERADALGSGLVADGHRRPLR
ncbi:MAG: hypothetical protein S0880_34090 [Actinomycetota bacterium]|nr:hypothetical protein [Actinomycetota bacterium]